MNLDVVVIISLVVLVIAQNIFWARMCLSLTNRLMSRDFHEFAVGKRIEKEKPQVLKPLQEEVIDPESERQAHELNSIFNMA